MAKPDPFARFAAFRIVISDDTRERQLAVIADAVRNPPPVRTSKRLGFRRRWAVAIASLTAVVAPVGTAVAAEGALPGEVLYPVKQVSEQVRAIFDDDLVATHRVEELERLLDVGADPALVAETSARAESEVASLDDPGELGPRLVRAQERVRLRIRQGGGTGEGLGDGPANEPTGSPGSGPAGPAGEQDRDRNGSGSGSPSTPPSSSGGGGADQGGSDQGGSSQGGSGSEGSGQGGGSGGGNGSGDGGPGPGGSSGSGDSGSGGGASGGAGSGASGG